MLYALLFYVRLHERPILEFIAYICTTIFNILHSDDHLAHIDSIKKYRYSAIALPMRYNGCRNQFQWQ